MPHHTVSESEGYEEQAQAARSQSQVTRVTAVIGAVVGLLMLLGVIFGFVFHADSKATEAHTRLDSLKADVIAPMKEDLKEIKQDVKDLAKIVTRRLPD